MAYLHRIKLCLLIGFLWFDFHHIFLEPETVETTPLPVFSPSSLQFGATPEDSVVRNHSELLTNYLSHNNSKVWVYDEERQQCLGWYGFSECGDVNLWVWRLTEQGLQLQSVFDQSICLGRSRLGGLKLRKCAQPELFGRTIYWTFNVETGALQSRGKVSNLLGQVCVVNDPSSSILAKCKDRYTPLSIIPLEEIIRQYSTLPNDSDSVSSSSSQEESSSIASSSFPTSFDPFRLPDRGTWKCPVTKKDLPRNIDKHLGVQSDGQGRQVMMGAGVFSKVVFGMKFNVYNLAWFVDAQAVQQDERFAPYYDLSYEELKQRPEFFALMTQPGGYSRSLYMKLAMTLKKDMVLQGLAEDLQITRENAKRLMDAGKAFTAKECPEGMEIIFTWRPAGYRQSAEEVVELRLGEEIYVELVGNGLGEDFLYQYFRESEPVSEEARPLLLSEFPLLLRTGYQYQPSPMSDETTPLDRAPAATATQPQRPKKDAVAHKTLKEWKTYLNSLLITPRHRSKEEELSMKITILLYLFVIILGSLPRLVREGKAVSVKVVNKIKNSASFENVRRIRRNLSRSTSLLTLSAYSAFAPLSPPPSSSSLPPPSSPLPSSSSSPSTVSRQQFL